MYYKKVKKTFVDGQLRLLCNMRSSRSCNFVIKIYNSKYDTMEDIKQPAEVRNLRAKEVDKAVRKAIWQYKIKHFWDK